MKKSKLIQILIKYKSDDIDINEATKKILDAQDESRNVSKNEDKKEFCDKCGKKANLYHYCGSCMINTYEHKRN